MAQFNLTSSLADRINFEQFLSSTAAEDVAAYKAAGGAREDFDVAWYWASFLDEQAAQELVDDLDEARDWFKAVYRQELAASFIAGHEVVIEADEPWTTGEREAVEEAIRTYAATVSTIDVQQFDDEVDLLMAADTDFLGVGANVHPDAKGLCFGTERAAQALTRALRANCNALGMVVHTFYLYEAE